MSHGRVIEAIDEPWTSHGRAMEGIDEPWTSHRWAIEGIEGIDEDIDEA